MFVNTSEKFALLKQVNNEGSLLINKSNLLLFCLNGIIFFLSILLGSWLHTDANTNDQYIKPTGYWDLLQNNLFVSFILISGVLCFGISTLIYLCLNGLIVGAAINDQLNQGMNKFEIFLNLVPHGLFEIPAFLVASVIGFKGLQIILELFLSKNHFKNDLKKITISILGLTSVMIFLLIIAATIEWFLIF